MAGRGNYPETCGWEAGCGARVSWRHAYCYRHWKAIPAAERTARVAAVFAARSVGPPASAPEPVLTAGELPVLTGLAVPKQRTEGGLGWLPRESWDWAAECLRATGESSDWVSAVDVISVFDWWLATRLGIEEWKRLPRPTRTEIRWWTVQAAVDAGGTWDAHEKLVRGVVLE